MNGTLTRIFVVLKPDQEAGPQSSFVFDSSNQDTANGATGVHGSAVPL